MASFDNVVDPKSLDETGEHPAGTSVDGSGTGVGDGAEYSNTSELALMTTSSVQTDFTSLNAIFSAKNAKPFVILEEGASHTAAPTSGTDTLVMQVLANAGCQTGEVGVSFYHKATQIPEMSYNPYTNKNIVKHELKTAEVKLEKTLCPESEWKPPTAVAASTQTDMAGFAVLHKATQHPDKEYPDPGHPPAPAPPIFWSEQLVASQLAAQQLQQQQQYLQQQYLQQQMQYTLLDSSTGLPLYPNVAASSQAHPSALTNQQAAWQYMQYPYQYSGNENM